jgi:hypothetical protein
MVTLIESNWYGIITEFKRIYDLMKTGLLLNLSRIVMELPRDESFRTAAIDLRIVNDQVNTIL